MEPRPSPARKAPTTRAALTVSEPAKMPSIRCHTTWQSRAAKPEQKNAAPKRRMPGRPPFRPARLPSLHEGPGSAEAELKRGVSRGALFPPQHPVHHQVGPGPRAEAPAQRFLVVIVAHPIQEGLRAPPRRFGVKQEEGVEDAGAALADVAEAQREDRKSTRL